MKQIPWLFPNFLGLFVFPIKIPRLFQSFFHDHTNPVYIYSTSKPEGLGWYDSDEPRSERSVEILWLYKCVRTIWIREQNHVLSDHEPTTAQPFPLHEWVSAGNTPLWVWGEPGATMWNTLQKKPQKKTYNNISAEKQEGTNTKKWNEMVDFVNPVIDFVCKSCCRYWLGPER